MVCLRTLFLAMMTQPAPQYSQANDLLVQSRLVTEETYTHAYDALLVKSLNNARQGWIKNLNITPQLAAAAANGNIYRTTGW